LPIGMSRAPAFIFAESRCCAEPEPELAALRGVVASVPSCAPRVSE